jgi:asparagine synthase (glutamine-hydrolysing)
MCGILGFWNGGSAITLRRMSAALAHRGPDDAGEWLSPDGKVGLAHRRLSIIELSNLGHQPMADAANGAVIVYNGEIYNFRELRLQLRAQGHVFRSSSDTEVLLALFRAHGDAMLGMLNGIFAFAIWDAARNELFLACDAMAVKPLYVSDSASGLLFASELKAMAAIMPSPALDVVALSRYLGFLWSPGGFTPINGVFRLGPGEAIRVRNGRIARRWRWAKAAGVMQSDVDEAEATRAVGHGLRIAVGRQMVADVEVGAFLSGGLDSSAVVAMAREFSPDIQCFTIDTGHTRDAGVEDDLPYARLAAKHLQVKLHEVRVSSSRMASDVEDMVVQLDEPLADPAPLNVLYISQLARQHGLKVLLSGTGGDDLFAGYRRHRALMLERYWTWLPQYLRETLRKGTSTFDVAGVWGRRAAKAFAHADESPNQRLLGYFLWADPALIAGLFAAEHRAAFAAEEITQPLVDYLRLLPSELAPLQQMLAIDQRFFLADHNLLYTDKMSMAVGVEVRVPFLDNDLVRLANGLPTDLKLRGGEGKWVLKKAMEPYLPREVIYRPKTGFGAPLRRWLRNELRDWVGDTLAADTLRRRGLFDPAAVARLIADDRAGRVDAAYTILGLACIEIWCRNFLDKAARAGRASG